MSKVQDLTDKQVYKEDSDMTRQEGTKYEDTTSGGVRPEIGRNLPARAAPHSRISVLVAKPAKVPDKKPKKRRVRRDIEGW